MASTTSGTRVERASDGLTIKQAAERSGIHYQTIRNWMRKYDRGEAGGLPYTEFGQAEPGKRRVIRIHPADLDGLRSGPSAG